MSTLSEQLGTQETLAVRQRLTDLRAAYAARGMKLSESGSVTMCIARALPVLEKLSPDELVERVAFHKVLPADRRVAGKVKTGPFDPPLSESLVIQEKPENRQRLAVVAERFNATPHDGHARGGNHLLLEASAVRLCIAVALPELLTEAGIHTAPSAAPVPVFSAE